MDIFRKDKQFTDRCVLALGDFDGIHLGHRALVVAVKEKATELDCKSGVYTFSVNTKEFLGIPGFARLTTENEKNGIIENLGLDFIYYDGFAEIKDLSPEQFCDYLSEKFNLAAVCCGENYTFGKFAAAGSKELSELMGKKGIECIIVPGVTVDGESISSSAVRKYISDGDMENAEKFLGYRYFINTKVIHGARLGRKLGFPTINQLEYCGKAVPKFGVYCCVCTVDGVKYKGVVNVGIRPTVSEGKENPPVIFETHIIDYNGDLYGKDVTVEFCKMLRGEKKFASLDELHGNVMKNISQARLYFENHPL